MSLRLCQCCRGPGKPKCQLVRLPIRFDLPGKRRRVKEGENEKEKKKNNINIINKYVINVNGDRGTRGKYRGNV